MEEFELLRSKTSDLKSRATQLLNVVKGAPGSQKLRSRVGALTGLVIRDASELPDLKLAEHARELAIYARSVSLEVAASDLPGEAKVLAAELKSEADELDEMSSAVLVQPIEVGMLVDRGVATPIAGTSEPTVFRVKEELDRHAQLIKKDLAATEAKVLKFSDELRNLASEAQNELVRIVDIHRKYAEEIQAQKAQADEALGHISAKSIAGSYEGSAAIEANAADRLRSWSIAAMAVIILIVGFTFLQSAAGAIDWQSVLTRLGMAFILTVPAGYLARESAKHRQQQYRYQQTSLELRTVTPYLASLPEERQHELKADIAQRIFGDRREIDLPTDLGIPNSNEIILELIKRLDRARKL